MLTSTWLALSVRILIAVATQTVFQPDEYFQSLEPAYHAVFGYGHLTWEWLAQKPIRSVIYPALNIPIFWALKYSGLSAAPIVGDWLLINGPKMLHGALAAITDVWLGEIALLWLGDQYVSTALFLSLTSFFNALALSRSFSNSLETSLTTIAFASYPWDARPELNPHLMYNRSGLTKTIVFSALACAIRPTNAVIWLFLYGNLFWLLKDKPLLARVVFSQILTVATLALSSLLVLDSLYYRKLTFTPWNFVLTNFSSVSLFYGINSWHYYFTQALPILCTTALPFALHGAWSVVRDKQATALRTMLATAMWYIGIFSLAGHKEWRFCHPILPLFHILATKSLVDLSRPLVRKFKQNAVKGRAHYPFLWKLSNGQLAISTKYLFFLLLNVPVALFVVLFYCRAPVSVLAHIRSFPDEDLKRGIGFLMPCHSTPGQAYLHRQELVHGEMWALGCEPPLGHGDVTTYHDQTDVFYQSPKHYLETYFPSRVDPAFPVSPFPTSKPGDPTTGIPTILNDGTLKYPWRYEWPNHLVFFGELLEHDGVRDFLNRKGYQEVWKKGWEWEGEGHRKGSVRVWQWDGLH